MANDPIIPDDLEPTVFHHPPETLPQKEEGGPGIPAAPTEEQIPLPQPRPEIPEVLPEPQKATPGPTVSPDLGLISPAGAQELVDPYAEDQARREAEIKTPLVDPYADVQSRMEGEAQQSVKTQPQEPQLGSVDSYVRGLKAGLVETLAAPVEIVDQVLRVAGGSILDKPGNATKAFKDAARTIGYNADDIDNMAFRMGHETFNGLLVLGSLVALAPKLAALPATGLGKWLLQRTGEGTLAAPSKALLGTVGGSSGGKALEESTGNSLMALPGAIAGDIGLNALVGTGAYGARKAGQLGAFLARSLSSIIDPAAVGANASLAGKGLSALFPPKPPATVATAPLFDKTVDRNTTTHFVQSQVDGANHQIERLFADAISSVPQRGTPEQIQTAMRKNLELAEAAAAKLESRFWARTPLKAKVGRDFVLPNLNAMQDSLMGSGIHRDFIPLAKMQELRQMWMPGAPGTAKNEPSIRQLRSYLATVRYQRRAEEAVAKSGGMPRSDLIDNLHALETIVNKGIADALPADRTIAQARAVSMKYHDLFTRSTLGRVMSTNMAGADTVRPENTMEALMKTYSGLSDLAKMVTGIPNIKTWYKASTAYPKAIQNLGAKDQAVFPMLQKDAEDSIRSLFREAAGNDPLQAQKWINKYEGVIKHMGTVSAELQVVSQHLQALSTEQQLLSKSAFARFSKFEDPDKAIARLFNSATPVKDVTELLSSTHNGRVMPISSDPQALEGLRHGMLLQLFNRSGLDPTRMKAMIGSPFDILPSKFSTNIFPKSTSMRATLEKVLSQEQMGRLDKMVDIAYRLERGDPQGKLQAASGPIMLATRVLSAKVGGFVGRLGGGGNIQTPAIFTQAAKQQMSKFLQGGDPKALLANAVMDQKWENLLLKKEPISVKQMDDLARHVERMTTIINGARQIELKDLLGQGDEKPAQKQTGPRAVHQGWLPEHPINRQGWEEFLKNAPDSQNLEDRRGNPFSGIGPQL